VAVPSATSAVKRDCVFVRGLEFEGNHGYTAAERKGTRRFRVSVTLYQALQSAADSDRLSDTVDYFAVSEAVIAVGTKSTFKLLEALAGAIAAKIFESYPQVEMMIEVEKLAPPCPGVPLSCGVQLWF
jgi:7,8-dihydroneopterin aldolase/epimerase/oxygenase